MKITHCKLEKFTQEKLLEFFVAKVAARAAADLLEIQSNKASLFSPYLSLQADDIFDGQVELDESYFGGHRKGKRGRGAAGKVAVFGIL